MNQYMIVLIQVHVKKSKKCIHGITFSNCPISCTNQDKSVNYNEVVTNNGYSPFLST